VEKKALRPALTLVLFTVLGDLKGLFLGLSALPHTVCSLGSARDGKDRGL